MSAINTDIPIQTESLEREPEKALALSSGPWPQYIAQCAQSAAPTKGTFTTPTGDRYEGGLHNGKPHGKGKYTYSNGDCYEGEFRHGKQTGKGTFTWVGGACYEGTFVNDSLTGKGKLTYPEGTCFEGEFSEGLLNGYGKLTTPDGDWYEGYFLNGQLNGIGQWVDPEIGESYQGNFVDSQRSGRGKLTFSNGDWYIGEFVDGQRTKGVCKLTLRDGSRYEGSLLDSRRTGWGRLTFTNGECWEGNFDKGHPIVDASNIGDELFVNLVIGNCQGAPAEYALGIMSDYLKQRTELESANQVARSQDDTQSETIYERLLQGESQLVRYGYENHGMGLNLVPDSDIPPKFVTFEIFNSGEGLETYHDIQASPDHPTKFQTMLRVQVPIDSVTAETIKRMLGCGEYSDIGTAYGAILNLPGATKVLPDSSDSAVWQTSQKSGNCSLEWIFAYLKNKMPEAEYTQMRKQLFSDCLVAIEANPKIPPELKSLIKAELIRKIEKRSVPS